MGGTLAGIDNFVYPSLMWAAFDVGNQLADLRSEVFKRKKTGDVDDDYEETIAIRGNLGL
jgi:hypothetical protein